MVHAPIRAHGEDNRHATSSFGKGKYNGTCIVSARSGATARNGYLRNLNVAEPPLPVRRTF